MTKIKTKQKCYSSHTDILTPVSALHAQELPVFSIICVSALKLFSQTLVKAITACVQSHLFQHCLFCSDAPLPLPSSPVCQFHLCQHYYCSATHPCHSHHHLCSVSHLCQHCLGSHLSEHHLCQHLLPLAASVSLTTAFPPSCLADHNHLLQSRLSQPSTSVSLITAI